MSDPLSDAMRQMVREELAALDIPRAVAEAIRAAMPPPAPVSMREAAEKLGVSYRTIQRRVKDGSLATVRLGARVLVALPRAESAEEVARLAHAARFG